MMRYNIYTILFLLLFSSCDDFLEEIPKDKIIPETVQEYDELLYGEAYMRAQDMVAKYLDLMTDDVKSYAKTRGFSDAREKAFGYYAWQADPEMAISGARNSDDAWEWYYHSILICNMTLEDLPDASGSLTDKEDVMGQAHFLRAWNYFMLVNLYGQPFNQETASIDLGVPINDVTGMEDKQFLRSSVAKNYSFIEEDLETAIDLLLSSNKEKDNFKININAAYLFASRVALYQKKYTEAIKFANLALANKSALYDLNSKNPSDRFINYKNPEIIFSYGEEVTPYYSSGYIYKSNFPISDDLGNLYVSGDLRKQNFFKSGLPKKNGSGETTGVFGFAMRTSELYLNRAEAYAESGEIDKAMKDINKLRSNRFSSADYMREATTKEEAINIIREERRMEFCFERHRWFDLRRWDRPSITHVFIRDKKNDVIETYVLKQDDPAYTLPLPFAVTTNNKEIKNIDRPERNPEN